QKAAHDPDDDVHQDPEALALHDLSGQESGDQPNQKPPDQPVQHGCPLKSAARCTTARACNGGQNSAGLPSPDPFWFWPKCSRRLCLSRCTCSERRVDASSFAVHSGFLPKVKRSPVESNTSFFFRPGSGSLR